MKLNINIYHLYQKEQKNIIISERIHCQKWYLHLRHQKHHQNMRRKFIPWLLENEHPKTLQRFEAALHADMAKPIKMTTNV